MPSAIAERRRRIRNAVAMGTAALVAGSWGVVAAAGKGVETSSAAPPSGATSGATSSDATPAATDSHLIDPGRGEPGWSGIVQASAVAPTGVEAEVRAKTALLAGPDRAADHLPHGGVLVLADGSVVKPTRDTPSVAA